MQNNMKIEVNSEIGKLQGVVIHTPGQEVENMTPENAERALYSDILNLAVAIKEYRQFSDVLKKVTNTFEVIDLLKYVLADSNAKDHLISNICMNEDVLCLKDYFNDLQNDRLAVELIEGVPMVKDTLTKYLSDERYELKPLHNFFFTRDASISVGNDVLIGKMKSQVREREALIMETIFKYHPLFETNTINPARYKNYNPKINFEGGDILIARDDVLLIGIGTRTSTEGVDFILDHFKQKRETKHILIQELPDTLESFIHLDMVFTFLDINKVMIYEPVIFNRHDYETVHIMVENGKVAKIEEEENLIKAMEKLKFNVEPIICGGESDDWIQEREQWHSGCNFFATAPGQVFGYGRNVNTLEELNKHGYEIIKASDVVDEIVNINDYKKWVVAIDGAELSRGGGGCRCMTMPLRRERVKWD